MGLAALWLYHTSPHRHGPSTYPRAEDDPSFGGVEAPGRVSRIRRRHEQQAFMREPLKEGAHEPAGDPSSPGSWDNPNADEFEVSPKPGRCHLWFQ